MLSNDTRITHKSNFPPHFRETVILSNFYKIPDETFSFCHLVQQELTHLPQCRIYGTINQASIDSDNGSSPIRHQAII